MSTGIVDRPWQVVANDFVLPSDEVLAETILNRSIRGALGEASPMAVRVGDVAFLTLGPAQREMRFYLVAAVEGSGRVWLAPLMQEYHNRGRNLVFPVAEFNRNAEWVVGNKTTVWQTGGGAAAVECVTFLVGGFFSGGGMWDGKPLYSIVAR